mmetsp:Transcript_1620/g.3502  ORF Transcript_1620/g.3502 Transcript_1620/m.3502 type:complete len:241 (+) Transcript_1620:1172-1894(+)
MAYGVTTEWEDIQRRLGNFAPKEKGPTEDELMKVRIDLAEQIDPEKLKTEEELEAEENDDALERYRQKRIEEMRALALKPRFGRVYEISRQDFIPEINQAPVGVWVVVHLYQTYVESSALLDQALERLASKFIHTKVVKIIATRAIENFADSDLPALLIYRDGSIVHQLLKCKSLFGGRIAPDTVEWVLANYGVWETEIEENPASRPSIKRISSKRDDLSDSDDDREYMSNHMPTGLRTL